MVVSSSVHALSEKKYIIFIISDIAAISSMDCSVWDSCVSKLFKRSHYFYRNVGSLQQKNPVFITNVPVHPRAADHKLDCQSVLNE